MKKSELNKKIRWTKGWQMTVKNFIEACKYSDSVELQNVAYGLDFAIRTGRLTCWSENKNGSRVLAINGKIISNRQGRALIVDAALRLTERTTAGGYAAMLAAIRDFKEKNTATA